MKNALETRIATSRGTMAAVTALSIPPGTDREGARAAGRAAAVLVAGPILAVLIAEAARAVRSGAAPSASAA